MAQLDPTLIINSPRPEQMDYAKTLGTIGLLKGQQQEQQVRASQIAHMQQQDAIAAQDRATIGQVGQAYATGGVEAAKPIAAAAGKFEIVKQLEAMDDEDRKRRVGIVTAGAPVLAQLRTINDPVQRQSALVQAIPLLRERGWDDQHIQAIKLDNNSLDLAVANARTIAEADAKIEKDRNFALDVDKFGHTVANDAAQIATQRRGQDITLRGQNLVDARAAEATAALGKPPAGYRWKGDGSLEAIKGGPGDTSAGGGKPLTETQAKATGYYGRATMANRTLNEFETKGAPPPGAGAKLADEIPLGLASGLIGDANQQQLAARRAFVAAVLRQESGAAISNSEFKSYDKLYFPQQGDTKETKNYKRQLRDQAAKSLAIAAGPGAGQMEMAIPATGGGVPADIAAILAKHK